MGPNTPPKCLARVGDRTLLARLLEMLKRCGVREAVLVVGHQAEAVIAEARKAAPGLALHPVQNPRYREGAILSLHSAAAFLDRNLLIMDADLLIPEGMLRRLLASRRINGILVDPNAEDSGEEQMVFSENARARHITKRPSESIRQAWPRAGEAVGVLKLSAEAAGILRQLLEQRVQAGETQIEHEQVYPDLFERAVVRVELIGDLPWTEIDTPGDLKRAQEEILPKIERSRCFNRLLSDLFLPGVLRVNLTPNQWTVISGGVGLFALAAFQMGGRDGFLLGALLFQLFYILDNWDGAVARNRGLSSRFGAWLDIGVDGLIQTLLPLALAAGVVRSGFAGTTSGSGGPSAWIGVGWVGAIGMALDFGVTAWAKLKGFGPSVEGDPARTPGQGAAPGWKRWWAVNLTNENFSLVVLAMVLLEAVPLFLLALAIGTQVFWVRFLLKERSRLFSPPRV